MCINGHTDGIRPATNVTISTPSHTVKEVRMFDKSQTSKDSLKSPIKHPYLQNSEDIMKAHQQEKYGHIRCTHSVTELKPGTVQTHQQKKYGHCRKMHSICHRTQTWNCTHSTNPVHECTAFVLLFLLLFIFLYYISSFFFFKGT